MSEVSRAFVDLLRKSPECPDHVRQGILASGEEAVEPLLELLGDPSVDAAGHPSQGQARIHAAGLLGVLKEPAAIDGLLDALLANRANGKLVGVIARALAHIGGVKEPALARLEVVEAEADRMMLAMVLASCGERDERIAALLRDMLPAEPQLVLPLVGRYGDPQLAPDVAKVLLAAGLDGRITALAVNTLEQLGITHPKLGELFDKASKKVQLEDAQELVDHAEKVLRETIRQHVARNPRPGEA